MDEVGREMKARGVIVKVEIIYIGNARQELNKIIFAGNTASIGKEKGIE